MQWNDDDGGGGGPHDAARTNRTLFRRHTDTSLRHRRQRCNIATVSGNKRTAMIMMNLFRCWQTVLCQKVQNVSTEELYSEKLTYEMDKQK